MANPGDILTELENAASQGAGYVEDTSNWTYHDPTQQPPLQQGVQNTAQQHAGQFGLGSLEQQAAAQLGLAPGMQGGPAPNLGSLLGQAVQPGTPIGDVVKQVNNEIGKQQAQSFMSAIPGYAKFGIGLAVVAVTVSAIVSIVKKAK